MRPGDVLQFDFGIPVGSATGFIRPAIVIAAQEFIVAGLGTLNVIPCSTTIRGWSAEVPIDGWGVAQCWSVLTPARVQIHEATGRNIGATVLRQIREVVADVLGISEDW